MISKSEKAKMLNANQIGPKMVQYLDAIGIEKLDDLSGVSAKELAIKINCELGYKHINKLGIRALDNLIKLADK